MRIKERYELALELRGYWAARREERGQMLDGYCLATGYNRKYAIEMLRDRRRKPRLTNRPRRRRYGQEFQRALKGLGLHLLGAVATVPSRPGEVA